MANQGFKRQARDFDGPERSARWFGPNRKMGIGNNETMGKWKNGKRKTERRKNEDSDLLCMAAAQKQEHFLANPCPKPYSDNRGVQ